MLQRSFSRFLLFVLAISSAMLHGQTEAPDANGRPVFKANARTVVVDVVVTDRKGKPVERLPKDDFVVMEDGHPQQITSFEEHSGAQAVPVNLPSLPPNIFTNIPRVKPTDSVTVLLLDSLNTEIQDQSFVRGEMLKYLKNLQPGRRMAIFTLGTQLRYIQGFTDDPAELIAALNDSGHGAGPQRSAVLQTRQEIAADQKTIAMMSEHAVAAAAALQQFQAEQSASQTSLRVNMTLDAFQQIAGYLAGIPGRKNLIWFSSAFPLVLFSNSDLNDSFATQNNFEDRVKKTDTMLAAAQVAIYPLAAEGVATNSLYDADQQAGAVVSGQMPTQAAAAQLATATPGQQANIQQSKSMLNDSMQRNANHTAMDVIAQETGGEAIYNTNGLNEALAKVADHGSYFYTLTYTPTNTAVDGRFRKIQVKLAHADVEGAKLAYRRGYYATDAKRAATTGPAADPLHPFMGPGLPDSTEIPLAVRVRRDGPAPGLDPALHTRSEATESKHAGDNNNLKGPFTHYTVDFVVAARGLQLAATPDGMHHGNIESTVVIYDRVGRPVNWIVRTVNLDMDAKRYAAVLENGVNFSLDIDSPQSGASLRSGVYDPATNLAGTLQIPFSDVVSVTPSAVASH